MNIRMKQIDTSSLPNINETRRRDRARRRKMIRCVSKQHHWDYSEIYILLECKLKCILDYAETDSVAVVESWRIPWIKRAINLAHHLGGVDKYPQHINIENASRFHESKHLRFDHDETNTTEIKSETLVGTLSHFDMNRVNAEMLYDIKARHLFFKILANYIGCWWD